MLRKNHQKKITAYKEDKSDKKEATDKKIKMTKDTNI